MFVSESNDQLINAILVERQSPERPYNRHPREYHRSLNVTIDKYRCIQEKSDEENWDSE